MIAVGRVIVFLKVEVKCARREGKLFLSDRVAGHGVEAGSTLCIRAPFCVGAVVLGVTRPFCRHRAHSLISVATGTRG